MTELMKQFQDETGIDLFGGWSYQIVNGMMTPPLSESPWMKFIQWLCDKLTWRPVSEKPKENVSVEVCDLSKSSLDEREPEIGYYENGEWFCIFPYDLNIYKKITPTHWRYIPPAPEGE